MANEQRQIEFALKTTEQFSTMAANTGVLAESMVKGILDCIDGSRTAKMFRNETLSAFYVDSAEKKAMIERFLRKQDIPFLTTKTKSGRDAVIVREGDQETLFNINRAIDQSKEPGWVSKDAVMIRGEGHIKSYEDLTYAQAVLFLRKAEESGLGIHVREAEQGKYDVFFAEKDAPEMVRISSSVAYDLAGKGGDILRRQLEYQEKNSCRIAERAAWPEPGLKDSSFYIVARNGDIAKRDAATFTYEMNDGRQYRIQAAKNEKQINTVTALMDRPVDLTPEQFAAFAKLDEKGRAAYLDRIDQEHGYCSFTLEEQAILQQKEASRSLIEEKLLQANPEQIYASQVLTNDDVSVASFVDSARDNFEVQHDMSQIGFTDPILLDDARAMQNGFIIVDDPFTGDTFYVPEEQDEDLSRDFDREFERDLAADIADDERYMDSHDINGNELVDDFEIPTPE